MSFCADELVKFSFNLFVSIHMPYKRYLKKIRIQAHPTPTIRKLFYLKFILVKVPVYK